MLKSPELQQADFWQISSVKADNSMPLLGRDRLNIAHEIILATSRPRRGAGLKLDYGFHASPFGDVLLITHERGLIGLGFVMGEDRTAALKDMQARWPAANFAHAQHVTAPFAQLIFAAQTCPPEGKLNLLLLGSAFEIMVWQGLLTIPAGQTTTYSALAASLGRPQAARAIGSAVGRNPLALLVPCHRVVGRNGTLTGYHWGLACKKAILQWEAGSGPLKD